MNTNTLLKTLKTQLKGELYFDDLMRKLYATDASVYRQLPLAVAIPKHKEDLKILINFASNHKIGLIPRTAGTSLAGQCVGSGIVVDISKYFTKIVHFNAANKTVTVQPGVVRDELNNYLKPFGLFFGPNTSTSNRCMLGGMVGNNSSGSTSIKYGVTRDKVLALETILSDGSELTFSNITKNQFKEKLKLNTLEGAIHRVIYDELKSETVQNTIKAEFPKPEIHRRNTGYAIDELIKTEVFSNSDTSFNICKLLAGSEGTLAFTTAIQLQLDDLPPKENALVALHFSSIEACLKSVSPLMKHDLYACEMMDDTILNLTKHNTAQQDNRAFIEGEPKAILMCELKAKLPHQLKESLDLFLETVNDLNLSYASPVLKGKAIDKAFELRKAGLGLLGNIIGDQKTVACIEDTAVALDDLEQYIAEFSELMTNYNQNPVYYAHAGAGELHLRPLLNLKTSEGVLQFKQITTDVAKLVKKYNGAMSGEHGDGIVRSSFVSMMIGKENYKILEAIKLSFDPQQIFNPGKIVHPLPLDENLRYQPDRTEPNIKTLLDFSKSQGILRETEKCNGSGDCRKLPEFGGTMCPSYRATKDEKDTTRARANALREFLTHSEKANRFNHEALQTVFKLCLSCKACKSECPSSVDVAALKAEFQYQYQKANGYKIKDWFFANATRFNKIASQMPKMSNFLFQNTMTSSFIKGMLGVHQKRSLPLISKPFTKHVNRFNLKLKKQPIKTVYLFIDEFTNYLESQIAADAVELLNALNYDVKYLHELESGRAQISKGFLEQAKTLANKNIAYCQTIITKDTPLIGIEPSAILTFKDEYLKLTNDKVAAASVANYTYLIEEFIQQEIKLGHITSAQFTKAPKTVKFHGHCHQKALSNQKSSFDVLNLPENYKVTIMPSGCCGMAGSFGYEKQNYKISMQIAEQTLLPSVRRSPKDTVISANGTSCRHQIKDGANVEAKHPITILKDALL